MIQSNVGDICMPNLIIRLETIFRDRLIEINLALKKVKKSYCELSVFWVMMACEKQLYSSEVSLYLNWSS